MKPATSPKRVSVVQMRHTTRLTKAQVVHMLAELIECEYDRDLLAATARLYASESCSCDHLVRIAYRYRNHWSGDCVLAA